MDTGNIIMIIVIIVLILMSAFFSGTEIAYSSLNKIRLKNLASSGNKKAMKALKMSENFDTVLSTILVGNTIVNIVCTTVSTVLFVNLFGTMGVTVSVIVITILVLLFGEITPKSIAKEKAESFAMATTQILTFFVYLLTPVNFIFRLWKTMLKKVFRLNKSEGYTEEELITIVEEVESGGGIDKHEGELIRSAIEFNDLDVEDILTPRVDIIGIEKDDATEKIAAVFLAEGYSRLPVYQETIDHVIGIIHEKDFHAEVLHGEKKLSEIIKAPVIVSKGTKISSLLRLLQHSKCHMAVVVDEFGGTVGIASLEDILEELVGEIWDEHDDEQIEFHLQSDGSYIISCNAHLSDVLELLDIFEDYEVSTVSGWVMQELGKVPEEGDTFTMHDWKITVIKTESRRAIDIHAELINLKGIHMEEPVEA